MTGLRAPETQCQGSSCSPSTDGQQYLLQFPQPLGLSNLSAGNENTWPAFLRRLFQGWNDIATSLMWTCPRDYQPDTNGRQHHCLFIYYLGSQQGHHPLPSLQTDSLTHKLFKKAERSGLTKLVSSLILKDKEKLLKLWVFWRQEVAGFQKGDIITCWRVNVVLLRRCFLRRNPSSKSPVEWLPKGAVPAMSKLDQSEHSPTPTVLTQRPWFAPSLGGSNLSPPHRTLSGQVFFFAPIVKVPSFPLSHALCLSFCPSNLWL